MYLPQNNKHNIVIQYSNDPALKGNRIFDSRINPDLSVFNRLKVFLLSHGINLDTPDLRTSRETQCAIYFDVPWIREVKDWRRIFHCRNNILVTVEPQMLNPFNYSRLVHIFFRKVYTWNTELVDNKKYFLYSRGFSNFGLKTAAKPFKDKGFLTFVGGNKLLPFLFLIMVKLGIFCGRELYSERLRAIDYFEKNIPDDFDFYGKGWDRPKKFIIKERILGFRKYKTYKGTVENKIETVSNYKFCLCFENATEMDGYITEKIFDCLKARCIPIYWGATDIGKYVPRNCFIDFRDFNGYDDLISHLKNMGEEEYGRRINSIEELLHGRVFMNTWFEDGWVENFYKKLGII